VNVNLVKCMECAERDIQRQTVRHVIQCPGTHIMPKKLRARLRNVNYDRRNSIKRSISKISQNTPASRVQIHHRSRGAVVMQTRLHNRLYIPHRTTTRDTEQ
jgi:hypothetical protein